MDDMTEGGTTADALSTTDTTTTDADKARAEQEQRGIVAERKRREAVEAELAKLKAAEAERVRKDAEARGEWERLAKEAQAENAALKAEREADKAFREAVEKREAEARAARIAKLPAEDRELLDGLTPEQIDARLPKLEARAATSTQATRQADTDARSGGSGGDPDALTEAQKAWWRDVRKGPANAAPNTIRKQFAVFGPKGKS